MREKISGTIEIGLNIDLGSNVSHVNLTLNSTMADVYSLLNYTNVLPKEWKVVATVISQPMLLMLLVFLKKYADIAKITMIHIMIEVLLNAQSVMSLVAIKLTETNILKNADVKKILTTMKNVINANIVNGQ